MRRSRHIGVYAQGAFNANSYTYSGVQTFFDEGGGNWRVSLLTSGTLTLRKAPIGGIDVFCVGGGGAGGGWNTCGGGGGCSRISGVGGAGNGGGYTGGKPGCLAGNGSNAVGGAGGENTGGGGGGGWGASGGPGGSGIVIIRNHRA